MVRIPKSHAKGPSRGGWVGGGVSTLSVNCVFAVKCLQNTGGLLILNWVHFQFTFLLYDLELHVHKMKLCPNEIKGRNVYFPHI